MAASCARISVHELHRLGKHQVPRKITALPDYHGMVDCRLSDRPLVPPASAGAGFDDLEHVGVRITLDYDLGGGALLHASQAVVDDEYVPGTSVVNSTIVAPPAGTCVV